MSREEPHVVAALVTLCKQIAVRCVVQVGAEDGYEAEAIREATGCRAVAIEGTTNSSPVSTGLEYYREIIGATNCNVTFYVHNSPGLSTLIARDDNEMATEREQMRLDTFCAAHAIEPDALIIDTEGTTLDVLEGCGELLKNVRLIYAECQTTPFRAGMRVVDEVDTHLNKFGFVRRDGLPAYGGGAQGNYTWIRL